MVGIRTLEDGEPFRPLVARFLIGDDVGLLARDHLENAFRLRIVFAQIDLDEAIARASLFVCLCAGGPAEEIACGTDSRAESHDRKSRSIAASRRIPVKSKGKVSTASRTAIWALKCEKESRAGCTAPRNPSTSGTDSATAASSNRNERFSRLFDMKIPIGVDCGVMMKVRAVRQ